MYKTYIHTQVQIHADTQTDRHMDRLAHRQTDRHTDRQTDRQTDDRAKMLPLVIWFSLYQLSESLTGLVGRSMA